MTRMRDDHEVEDRLAKHEALSLLSFFRQGYGAGV